MEKIILKLKNNKLKNFNKLKEKSFKINCIINKIINKKSNFKKLNYNRNHKRNYNKKIIIVCIFIICVFFFMQSNVYAADPTLVNKINSAFKKILGYLQKISTPIAGVTIATGVIMRKLSFGDEEKMVKGKKVIVNAIVGYCIIISIDLIIKFIEALL